MIDDKDNKIYKLTTKDQYDQEFESKLKFLFDTETQKEIRHLGELVSAVCVKVEPKYKKTLWITLVSNNFKGVSKREVVYKLTDLTMEHCSKLSSNWLFGFEAFTVKEWEKIVDNGIEF